jgi:hypothetical protein
MREHLMGDVLTNHHSRIACATGDGKAFKEIIDQLSQ